MRNPTLHLIGITTSPGVGDKGVGGGSVFNTSRAEEELRHWLETRLDALGIDPVAYSRFVLSLLRRPDSALSPIDSIIGKGAARRARARYQQSAQHEQREQKRAVIQCLTSAAEHACGVETLVDELCERLDNLSKIDDKSSEPVAKDETDLETLSPRDKAQRYFKAFPALRATTPKQRSTSDSVTKTESKQTETETQTPDALPELSKPKSTHGFLTYTESKNIRNKSGPKQTKKKARKSNKNNNNSYSFRNKNNNTMNNKVIGKAGGQFEIITEIKSDPPSLEKEDTYGFTKSIEMQREQEQELYRQRLAQLEAKFDRSLELLWSNGTNSNSDRDSIWAAPNLSMPESSAWPIEPKIANKLSGSAGDSPDDINKCISPFYPWDLEWDSPQNSYDNALMESNSCSMPWSNQGGDNPWRWQGVNQNCSELKDSPIHYYQMPPCKNVTDGSAKDSCPKKASSLPEPEEDLLTSARTHFRPIKEDGVWADGTTFPINNKVERVAYRRSESGNLLYLPGGDSPYMEFRPKTTPSPIISSNLTPKFRVRQCDKYVQTDPAWSPVKRRIISDDEIYYKEGSSGENWVSVIEDSLKFVDDNSFTMDPTADNNQSAIILHNERKRRHSSSFTHGTLRELRPLTL